MKQSKDPKKDEAFSKKQKSESQARLDRLLADLRLEEEGEVRPERITQTLQDNYMPYAMSVIVSRAIPEIDGLKPSHRKLLYTMYKMGLLRGKRTKSANIVGQTMRLNPHGDGPIYETMVRLTRGNGALLHPYIDSKGNFGKHYSSEMAFAAPRYTEAKLDSFAAELFDGIDEDMVDFSPNYDGTMEEPLLLPASFPSVLVNANQGIAVGMASNICSFNLAEVCDTTVAYLKDPSVDLLDTLPAPDFSGGAELIYDRAKMRQIYESGQGSFALRSRYRVDKKEHLIEIYEIPYCSSVEIIMNELSNLVKDGKLREVNDVRDETDLGGLALTIDYKRSADPEQLMQKLFSMTSLQSRFSCNFNILVRGEARVLSVREILDEWIQFRRQAVRRRLAFEDKNIAAKLHLLQGLSLILLDIDKAVRIVRQTEKEAEVVPRLMQAFGIDEIQANYVAEIRLRQLNREYILKRTSEIEDLEKRREDIAKTLREEARLRRLIIHDLERVKKLYGEARRTQLVAAHEVNEIEKEDLIEDYRLKYFLTREGYFKKLPLTSLRSAGELRLKENDEIIQAAAASNKQELLIFTSAAALYKLRLYEFPDDKPSDWGSYLPSFLSLEKGERVLYVHALPEQSYKGEMIFAYENGRVSRVDLSQYETVQRRRKLIKVCNDKSPLVAADFLSEAESGGSVDFVLMSNQERALLFSHDLIQKKSTRSNSGDQVMRMAKKYKIVRFARAERFRFEEASRYRARKLPASGVGLKESKGAGTQLCFDLFSESAGGANGVGPAV